MAPKGSAAHSRAVSAANPRCRFKELESPKGAMARLLGLFRNAAVAPFGALDE